MSGRTSQLGGPTDDPGFSPDEEILATYLATSCERLARAAGIDPAEMWELQFEGRSGTINVTVNRDGTETINVEFDGPRGPEDGDVEWTMKVEWA